MMKTSPPTIDSLRQLKKPCVYQRTLQLFEKTSESQMGIRLYA